MSKTALAQAWEKPDLYATCLLLLFLDQFQDQGENENPDLPHSPCTDWDPETIGLSLQELNIQLTAAAMSRLLVAIQIFSSNRFRQDLPTFNQFCNVLSGDVLTNDAFDPADLDEVAWGLTEAYLISVPDKNDPNPYSEDVKSFVARLVDDAGLMSTPSILQLGEPTEQRSLPAEFTDDPTMFSAIYAAEDQKNNDLSELLRDRLSLLLAQIQQLPLRNGSPEKARELLQRL